MKTLLQYLTNLYRRWKAQRAVTIPPGYFKGYRRLAKADQHREPGKCWACKHAVARVTWHCDLETPCQWEPCYKVDEITKADYKLGDRLQFGWIRLPAEEDDI